MLSKDAIMGIANESRHVIITDLVTNIQKIEKLLKSIDSPNSGMVLGQYVVRNAFMNNLIELAKQIMDSDCSRSKTNVDSSSGSQEYFYCFNPIHCRKNHIGASAFG